MFIYQDGKLYVQEEENNIVGVEIYPDKIVKLEGIRTKLSKNHTLLSLYEVQRKFQIIKGKNYIFPVEKKQVKVETKKVVEKPVEKEVIKPVVKGVEKNVTTNKPKTTTRKSTGK